jgi:hypothetical protein
VEGVFRLRFAELNGAFVGLRTGLMFAAPFAAAPSLGLEVGASSLIAHRLYVGASVGARKVFLLRHGLRPDAGPSFRLVAGVAF